MTEGVLLAYLFLSFSVGIACLGILVVLARRHPQGLARPFLMLYTATSVLIIGRLLQVFQSLQDPSSSTMLTFEWLEAFPGRYGLTFLLPFFVHRLVGLRRPRLEWALLVVVLMAALGQHITEYVLPKVWDDRGDIAEDVFMAIVVSYALWVAVRHQPPPSQHRLKQRFLVIMAICVPGITYDLFLADGTLFRFYPIWFATFSVVFTWTMWQDSRSSQQPLATSQWGLSEREAEVLQLVCRGLSNKEIGLQMCISPNTVKTHLRAIFEKVGVHSRFALISLGLTGEPDVSSRS